jgi:hypothetical protein
MIPDRQVFDHISTMYATQVYPIVGINNGIQEKEEHNNDVYVIDEEEDIDFASLSSSISNIDVETIDYHAVYARHVFIAAVEGQISVMQDDKLFLLDDTNAYWWLVRIIKTSDVGYIPAESIEVGKRKERTCQVAFFGCIYAKRFFIVFRRRSSAWLASTRCETLK